jgi:hypothetical protein
VGEGGGNKKNLKKKKGLRYLLLTVVWSWGSVLGSFPRETPAGVPRDLLHGFRAEVAQPVLDPSKEHRGFRGSHFILTKLTLMEMPIPAWEEPEVSRITSKGYRDGHGKCRSRTFSCSHGDVGGSCTFSFYFHSVLLDKKIGNTCNS